MTSRRAAPTWACGGGEQHLDDVQPQARMPGREPPRADDRGVRAVIGQHQHLVTVHGSSGRPPASTCAASAASVAVMPASSLCTGMATQSSQRAAGGVSTSGRSASSARGKSQTYVPPVPGVCRSRGWGRDNSVHSEGKGRHGSLAVLRSGTLVTPVADAWERSTPITPARAGLK